MEAKETRGRGGMGGGCTRLKSINTAPRNGVLLSIPGPDADGDGQ